MEPIFIKADLSFDPPSAEPENEMGISSQAVTFLRQNISTFGCMGLPWGNLSSEQDFGKKVSVTVRSVQPGNLFFTTDAWIIREFAMNSEHLGLRFDLRPEQRDRLAEQVRQHGFSPADIVRKYPRIPSTARIATFPLRVVGVSLPSLPRDTYPSGESGPHLGIPIIYEVQNLSPNGILLSSENRLALNIVPGSRVQLTLEPRGPFTYSVQVQALVCRVTDSIEPASGNVVRLLGLKFAHVDAVNRAAFLELLRDILERIKTQR